MAETEGIQRLLQAEDEASRIVKLAREGRVKRLREAKEDARKAIELLREEHDHILKTEFSAGDGQADVYVQQQRDATAKELKRNEEGYREHEQEAIQLLLHHVTTVDNTHLSEATKQYVRAANLDG